MRKFTENFSITKNFNDLINDDIVVYDEKGKMEDKIEYFNELSHEEIGLTEIESFKAKYNSYQMFKASFDDGSIAGIMLIENDEDKTFFYINTKNDTYINIEKGYLVLEDAERLYLYFFEDGSFYIHY